jgi:hypothetical protein
MVTMTDDQAQGVGDQGERPHEQPEPDETGQHGSTPGQVADVDGRRGETREAGDAKAAATGTATPPATLDAASARAAQGTRADEPRRCGFSLCRKVLPDEATGRKLDYCREQDTTWPIGEDRKPATCRELGRAERALAAVTGARAAVAEVNVVELSEHVDAVLGPVQSVVGPVTALLDTLTGVRGALDGAVATARAEREEALRQVADADSRAEVSRRKAVEAEAAKSDAVEAKEAAERAARKDRADREKANDAKNKAEGRVQELQDNLERANERIEPLVERVTKAAEDLARTEGERDAARAAIAEEKRRADAQEQRANNAVAAATELERTLRIEFAGKLQQQASEHQQALDDARTDYDQRLAQAARDTEAAVQRAREEVEAARAGDRREHAEQIGQLNQQLGALTQRAEGAETGQREQAGLLSELRAAVAAALAALGEDGDDLRQQYQHLVQEQ